MYYKRFPPPYYLLLSVGITNVLDEQYVVWNKQYRRLPPPKHYMMLVKEGRIDDVVIYLYWLLSRTDLIKYGNKHTPVGGSDVGKSCLMMMMCGIYILDDRIPTTQPRRDGNGQNLY